jgi:hypothetical protein
MRCFILPTLIAGVLAFSVACHPGPILNTGSQRSVGGTIAGNVRATGGAVALVGRKVTAIDVATGARYETSTSVTGGYTIKVPEGTYRLDVELHEGETVVKRPGATRINNSDLDPARDFEVTVKPAAR